jgi:hypothetical protein
LGVMGSERMYRVRVGGSVYVEVPGGFDPDELCALLAAAREVSGC